MGKIIVLTILAIIVGLVAFLAVSAAVAWVWHLVAADRQAVRDDTREARWATEDLQDAVARQTKRKSK